MAWYWSRPTKTAARRPCGVEKKLSMMVATAGTCVNVAKRTTAGNARSQPCTWMLRCACFRSIGARMSRPLIGSGRPCLSVLIGSEDAVRLRLGFVERGLGRLGAGQGRLQGIVERLGDALIVVRRQLGDGVLELVTRDHGCWESGHTFLHRGRLPGIGAGCDIAGGDAPVGRALGRGEEAGELECRRQLGL